MSELGPVGIGLSVAFAAFMIVLAVEIIYIWRSRQRRIATERRPRMVEEGVAVAVVAPLEFAQKWKQFEAVAEKGLMWVVCESREAVGWARKQALGFRTQWQTKFAVAKPEVCAGNSVAVPPAVAAPEAADDTDEEDLFRLGGLWEGPSRLLFTITEETNEEMELEDPKLRGKGSRRPSRASSELVFVPSACTSPYQTPPSSPPFATPIGSPDPLPLPKAFVESMSSSSSSSSTTSSSPPPHRRPLAALFEETSSFSSSSATSSSATPAAMSPPPPLPPQSAPCSPKRQRRTLGLLFDPPPSPTSALYHYHHYHHHQRVHPHPLSPPSFRLPSIEGNPIFSSKNDAQLPSSPPIQPPPSPPKFHLPDPPKPTTPSPFCASALHASTHLPNGRVSPKGKLTNAPMA